MAAKTGPASDSATAGTGPQPRPLRSFDLRERRRSRMRLMIQAEAFRLFAEKGYAETTVEEIADAAAISPRTFFRYFPAKEDVVLWDEYDPLALELLESRPDDEPLAEGVRALIRHVVDGLYRRDPRQLLARYQLISSVPELRARFLETQSAGVELAAAAIARKRNVAADDLQLQVTAAALGAAVNVAFQRWQRDRGESDLPALFDQAVEALVNGVRDLHHTELSAVLVGWGRRGVGLGRHGFGRSRRGIGQGHCGAGRRRRGAGQGHRGAGRRHHGRLQLALGAQGKKHGQYHDSDREPPAVVRDGLGRDDRVVT